MTAGWYCIDTSALVDLGKFYPWKRFPSLWDRLGDLADRAMLTAPDIVHRELARGAKGDDGLTWCESHPAMFVAVEILQEFTRLLMNKFSKDGIDIHHIDQANEADVWVVAWALRHQALVISHEGRSGPNTPKIPRLCECARLEHDRLLRIIVDNDWSF